MKKRILGVGLTAISFVLMAGVMCGCRSTYQARSVKPTGFLGDYSQLRAGKADETLLTYVNPSVEFRKYDKVMFDPVRIYATSSRSMARLPKEDLQRIVNYFDAAAWVHLKKNFTLVSEPGPGVMRIRAAITEAKGANVVLDTISTVIPVGLALSEVKRIATGTHASVGSAGVEVEGLDSMSNLRMFALADARVGRKITGKFDKFSKWRTVNDAFEYWGEYLQHYLLAQRKGIEAPR